MSRVDIIRWGRGFGDCRRVSCRSGTHTGGCTRYTSAASRKQMHVMNGARRMAMAFIAGFLVASVAAQAATAIYFLM